MKKMIYLVEDDADIKEIVEFLLGHLGYTVQGVGSAAAFREKMASGLPDLIILDIMLPDGNGLDICKALKSTPGTQHIPVLLMSANVNSRTVVAESHANGFISKPFDIDDFATKIVEQIA